MNDLFNKFLLIQKKFLSVWDNIPNLYAFYKIKRIKS